MPQKNTQIIIVLLAISLIIMRMIFPALKFDDTSLTLFIIATITLLIPDVGELLGRIRKVKKGDLEIELDQLKKTASAANDEIPELLSEKDISEGDQIVQTVLKETSRSKKLGLISLAMKIEREIRQLLLSLGYPEQGRHRNLLIATEVLFNRKAFSSVMLDSLHKFWAVRNKIVHGHDVKEDDIISAVDSGILIFKALKAIPHEINIIYHPGVEIFENEGCTVPRKGVKGVILETTSPGGTSKSFRIYPTTKTDYSKNERVSWEWNMKKSWPETWYRDPDTNSIKYAWTGASEFVGRRLDELT